MRVLYAVVCEDARARQDDRLDIIGIFHSLAATGFPAMQERITLVVEIEWSAEEAGTQEFRIDLVDPASAPTFTITASTEVWAWSGVGEPPRSVLVMELPDVRFPSPGEYLFQLHLQDVTVALTPLYLLELPDAASPGDSA